MTEISKLDELAAKATGGEWYQRDVEICSLDEEAPHDPWIIAECFSDDDTTPFAGEDDAALIVAAVNNLRRLLATPEGRDAIERVNHD